MGNVLAMTNTGQPSTPHAAVAHAMDRRGYVVCGDNTSGTERVNVDKYPEEIVLVTCPACKAELLEGDADLITVEDRDRELARRRAAN